MILIGIVTYNSLQDLPNILENLAKQSYQSFRLFIFDNYSEDGTVEWLKQHCKPHQYHLNQINVGFGQGHNWIIQHHRQTSHYLCLNPDIQLEKDFLHRLFHGIQEHQAHWGGGTLLQMDSKSTIYSIGHGLLKSGYAFNIGYGLEKDQVATKSYEVFGICGAAVLYTHKFCQIMGNQLFDSSMFMYCEDTDLDWRARQMGLHAWYIHDAVAFHRGSQPNHQLRLEAISNRYISVIKNACLTYLLFYNLPYIFIHIMFRFIFNPSQGIILLKLLFSKRLSAWEKRRAMRHRCDITQYWIQWSLSQPTAQPLSIRERISKYWKTKQA